MVDAIRRHRLTRPTRRIFPHVRNSMLLLHFMVVPQLLLALMRNGHIWPPLQHASASALPSALLTSALRRLAPPLHHPPTIIHLQLLVALHQRCCRQFSNTLL